MDNQVNSGLEEHLLKMQYNYEHRVRMQTLANDYALLILKWYFLLNSGGLIGTLTLLGLKSGTYIYLCKILAPLFTLGIISIITACKLDRKRILPEFDTSANKQGIPARGCVNTFEWLSILCFTMGLIIAIVSLFDVP